MLFNKGMLDITYRVRSRDLPDFSLVYTQLRQGMAIRCYFTRVYLNPHVGFDPAGIWTYPTVATTYNQLRQPMAYTCYLTLVMLHPPIGFDPATFRLQLHGIPNCANEWHLDVT